MTEQDGAQRLWQAAQAAAINPETLTAWLGPPPEPAPGQIWRARWGGVAEAVLLITAQGNAVETLPVTFDDEEADAGAVLVDKSDSTLDTGIVIWFDIQTTLPTRVLERHLGSVSARLSNLDWSHLVDGMDGLERGEELVYDSDPRRAVRAELEDRLEELSRADWLGAGSGELGQILRDAGLTPSALADTLDIPVQRSMSILRGQVAITQEEAERLSKAVGRTAAELLASNPVPPADIVSLLDQPGRRSQILMFAEKRGIPEIEARREAAFGTLALAARQTGDTKAPEWGSRLDRYFEVVLGE